MIVSFQGSLKPLLDFVFENIQWLINEEKCLCFFFDHFIPCRLESYGLVISWDVVKSDCKRQINVAKIIGQKKNMLIFRQFILFPIIFLKDFFNRIVKHNTVL